MRQVTPNELVANQLQSLLGRDSAYLTNARRRGAEFAGSRGNINSSIAAGASERAALEAALPIAQQDAATYEGANRQNADSLFGIRDAQVQARLQDWMASQDFNRQFNGQLALMPIANSADMWNSLMQLAASDPTIFTPDVLAGYQDFFQRGFDEYIARYLAPPGG